MNSNRTVATLLATTIAAIASGLCADGLRDLVPLWMAASVAISVGMLAFGVVLMECIPARKFRRRALAARPVSRAPRRPRQSGWAELGQFQIRPVRGDFHALQHHS